MHRLILSFDDLFRYQVSRRLTVRYLTPQFIQDEQPLPPKPGLLLRMWFRGAGGVLGADRTWRA